MQASAPTMVEPVDLTLPFSAESAHVARDYLVSWLDGISANVEERDDARLIISELVGNAIRHARPLDGGTVMVGWAVDADGLSISVTDGGARTTPERVDAGVSSLSGRGLSIVETLATRWWVESSRSRTTVHARIALD